MSTTSLWARTRAARWAPLLAALALHFPPASAAETSPKGDPTRSVGNSALRVADIWDPLAADREYWTPQRSDAEQRKRLRRHETFTRNGVPEPYRGIANPLGITPEVVNAGAVTYANWCADCHGEEGMGDGVFALSLQPSPALLAFLIQVPMAVDEYLAWSISEGGSAFGTDMPGFSDLLTAEEIWSVISYMRAGFPVIEGPDAQAP